jgi:hypothetical protein
MEDREALLPYAPLCVMHGVDQPKITTAGLCQITSV